jgi:hypothetical protein
MQEVTVYAIAFDAGPIYVGMTSDMTRRLGEHRRRHEREALSCYLEPVKSDAKRMAEAKIPGGLSGQGVNECAGNAQGERWQGPTPRPGRSGAFEGACCPTAKWGGEIVPRLLEFSQGRRRGNWRSQPHPAGWPTREVRSSVAGRVQHEHAIISSRTAGAAFVGEG